MANENRQGTGRHGHKDTQEPWPHRQDQSQQQAQSERRQDGSDDSSLKAREYRDEQGNVHHHTKTYMEQHRGKDR
ncbi:hypothetical protein [Rhodoligotrophos defluvii]|uniref:hypothetical protein n=1 Tax=Rhodoligotrophos defluvii TaxID=2561934 RepID=UPI0010C947C0|nr:hypothetical protein [Rhodoligotrophos defluvii]